ncbi:MAG TPA: ATP-binding protein [Acidimicrobiales bacterium]|nr:ATP-binding protein [Acidimicrobiales bacterium]
MSESFSVASGAIGELFFNVNDAVVIARDGRFVAWSPSAESLFGLTAAEATDPTTDLGTVFGSGLSALWDLIEAGGQAVIDCAGGSERVVEATAWHLGEDEAGPTVAVMHDITRERRHVQGLETLNALARELLAEPSIDVLLARIVDAAKDLTHADFSALITVRDSAEEVEQFLYNAPRERFPARLPRVVGLLAVPMATRSVVRIDDIRGHPAGVGIPVQHPPIASLLAAPILVGDRLVGELAVANEPGRPAFDELDEAMLTELAAHGAMAVSLVGAREAEAHVAATRRAIMDTALLNIRTPLNVAKGFLATIRDRGPELSQEELDHAFDAIDRAHDRIQRLAEDGLLDPPPATSHPRSVDVVYVVPMGEQLLDDLAPVRPDVELRWDAEPSAPASFLGDARLVREVLENLIANAVKHAPPSTTVTVTVRQDGSSVRFDVTDQGPGIPPTEQSRVFEQFYRTRQSIEEALPGAGLGLWIARRLTEVMGGTVGLSSRPGQGTTFWATVPLLSADDGGGANGQA